MLAAAFPRRFAWLTLLVAALCVRALTPDGWMPNATGHGGVALTWCTGMGGETVMAATDGHGEHRQPAPSGHASHPCAFAGIGIAGAAPPLPTLAMPLVGGRSVPVAIAVERQPGRGLAAPPPPATGPPILA